MKGDNLTRHLDYQSFGLITAINNFFRIDFLAYRFSQAHTSTFYHKSVSETVRL